MKRTVWIGLAASAMVWLVLASCSNPLETTPPPQPGNPFESIDTLTILDTLTRVDTVLVGDSLCADTVYITNCEDTVFVGDTVHVTDTVTVSDTVIVTDTLRVVDTVVAVDTVVVRDCDDDDVDKDCKKFCEKINSHNKQITWRLDNEAGHYRLDFSAWTERNKPTQKLWISVGGETYCWTPSSDDHFCLDLDLPADACVKVWLDNPKACGHEIKVCLKMTKL